MKRRGKKKRSPELIALQENFWLEVVLAGDSEGAAQPCWYGDNIESPLQCEGRIIASHFIKRQRIGNAVWTWHLHEPPFARTLIVQEAEWDPRFAVPSCQAHDDRWDGHQMPPLVIYRHQVPSLVEMAAADWGIGEQIAHRCPSISAECPVETGQTNEEERFAAEISGSERALLDD